MRLFINPTTSISISDGNSKLGNIPSFRLPSGQTCSDTACRTCYKEGCYARKLEWIRPSVATAYADNYRACRENLDEVHDALLHYFSAPNAPRYFRLHTSGDFFSAEYASMIFNVAENSPNTHFLAFTKQFDIVREIPFSALPNFSLRLSAWIGVDVPADLAGIYPISYVDSANNPLNIPNAYRCTGDCTNCMICWQKSVDTIFAKH